MVDTVPGSIASGAVLKNFGSVNGRVDTSGDKDWYGVELEAGKTYEFVVQGRDGVTDWLAVPSAVRVYNAAGTLLATGPLAAQGVVTLIYTPAVSGSFFVAAGGAGTQTGQFTMTMRETRADTPPPPEPLLQAIDWESKLEGAVFKVYFAQAGEAAGEWTSLGWTDYEIARLLDVFDAYERIINVTIERTFVADEAQIKLAVRESDPTDEPGAATLGACNPPGEVNQGAGIFYRAGDGWNETGGLLPGGNGFQTVLHELGHAFGLKHPHDEGGRNGPVMTGVSGPFDDYGAFNLNQGVYTTMSYNAGWALHPNAPAAGTNFGQAGALMALDIAMLQFKYGANTTTGAGDTVYTLPASNTAGVAFWSSIWDVSGTDTLRAPVGSTRVATLDLRAATIDYTATGGGLISFLSGIQGGFTIARGAVIENAIGADGADKITGNAVANVLDGGLGNDVLNGREGDDILLGGGGVDTLNGGFGNDRLDGGLGGDNLAGGLGNDTYVRGAFDTITELANAGIDTVETALALTLGANVENLKFTGAAAVNGTGNVLNNVITGNGAANVLKGLDGHDTLVGGAGADTLEGGLGNDVLTGGAGEDTLTGGAGADRFRFALIADEAGGWIDSVTDFSRAQGDKIDLSGLDANQAVFGNQAFAWIGTAAFTAAGQLRYEADGAGGWFVEANVNAGFAADLIIQLTSVTTPVFADFVP